MTNGKKFLRKADVFVSDDDFEDIAEILRNYPEFVRSALVIIKAQTDYTILHDLHVMWDKNFEPYLFHKFVKLFS